MKIIRPVKTICENIVSSNVPLVEPLYSAATTYSKGSRVVNDACGATVYESLANSNTNHPVTDTAWWLPIGASNYYAMFDTKIGTQTTNPDSIVIEVSLNALVNSVALINVDANTARFEAWNLVNEKILDMTVSLRDLGRVDYYDYFTRELEILENYVTFEIPTIGQGRGKLTLEKTGSTAKLGALIYGSQFELGKTLYGATVGIKDFSTKEDDIFGNYIIISRGYRDKIEVDLFVPLNNINRLRKVLSDYRTEPLVWSAEDETGTLLTYGYYKDFSIVLSNPLGADCSLQIEGLT
jgi:hypothetical protein